MKRPKSTYGPNPSAGFFRRGGTCIAELPACGCPDRPGATATATFCRLEIGDTAGWKPALRRKGRTLSTTLRCRLSFRRRHRPDQLVEIIRYIWPEE